MGFEVVAIKIRIEFVLLHIGDGSDKNLNLKGGSIESILHYAVTSII